MVVKHLGLAVAGVALVCSVAACGGTAKPTPKASPPSTAKLNLVTPGVLTIANYGTGLPDVLVRPNNTLGGLDGMFLTSFAKAYGLKITLIDTTLASDILEVEDHKADLAPFFYYKTVRAQAVYYTYPQFAEGPAVYTLKTVHYPGLAALKSSGAKIAVVAGGAWATYVQPYFGSQMVEYPSTALAANALYNGDVKAYIDGSAVIFDPPFSSKSSPPVTETLLKAGQLPGLTATQIVNYAYNIVNCKAKGLASALDAYQVKLHKNGQWAKMLKAAGFSGSELTEALSVPQATPIELCG